MIHGYKRRGSGLDTQYALMSVRGPENMVVGLPLLCLFAFARAVPSPCLPCLLNYHSPSLDMSYDTIFVTIAL